MTLDTPGMLLLSRSNQSRSKAPHAELILAHLNHFVLLKNPVQLVWRKTRCCSVCLCYLTFIVLMVRLRWAKLKKSVGQMTVSGKDVFFPILVWKVVWKDRNGKGIWWCWADVWLTWSPAIHCLVSDERFASWKCESVPGLFLWLWHLCHSDRVLFPRKPGRPTEKWRYETGLDVQVLPPDGSN